MLAVGEETRQSVLSSRRGSLAPSVNEGRAAVEYDRSITASIRSTPEELDRFWKEQLALYEQIAQKANVKLTMQ